MTVTFTDKNLFLTRPYVTPIRNLTSPKASHVIGVLVDNAFSSPFSRDMNLSTELGLQEIRDLTTIHRVYETLVPSESRLPDSLLFLLVYYSGFSQTLKTCLKNIR